MYIKDLTNGVVRRYGGNIHDSLRISSDGRTLSYANLQNGDGSRYGDYRFVVDENGETPEEDEVLRVYGADAYFNIGGFMDVYILALIREYKLDLKPREELTPFERDIVDYMRCGDEL